MEERLQVRCCTTPGHPLAPRDPREQSSLAGGLQRVEPRGPSAGHTWYCSSQAQSQEQGLGWAPQGCSAKPLPSYRSPPRHKQGLLEPLRQSWASPRAPAWGYLSQYSSPPPTSAPPTWIGSGTRFVPGHTRDVPLRLPR